MRNITAKKWGRLIQSLISKGTEDKSSESREEQMEVINNVSKKLRDDPKEEIRSDSGLLLHSWKHRRGTNMADVDKNLESKPINSNIEMDSDLQDNTKPDNSGKASNLFLC